MIGNGIDAGADIHTSLQPQPTAEAALARLAEQAQRDLDALAHPSSAWVRPVADAMGRQVYDVVIVGAGQAGLIVGLALKREGIRNILLLDRNPAGYEGPWDTFARMEVLRTPKTLVGAEFGIPSLSVLPGSRRATAPKHGRRSPGSRGATGCAICAGTAGSPISLSATTSRLSASRRRGRCWR